MTKKKKATLKKKKQSTVKIKFANKTAAKYFLSWLCKSGEEQYWDWKYREDEDYDKYAADFRYDIENLTVDTLLGRLDDDNSDTVERVIEDGDDDCWVEDPRSLTDDDDSDF